MARRNGRARKAGRKRRSIKWRDIFFILCLGVIVAFFVNREFLTSTVVEGHSMEPTLHDQDRLFLWKQNLDEKHLRHGDIVVFHAPDEQKDYIKRIIALPNDFVQIKDGRVFVNGRALEEPYLQIRFTRATDSQSWLVGEDEIFVLGDNREEGASRDSRMFGPVPLSSLIGVACFRFYPFHRWGSL